MHKISKWGFAVLIIIATIRLFTINIYDLWNDEIFTKSIVDHAQLEEVINATINQSGGNALLYNSVLFFWKSIFGMSNISLRFFSFICIIFASIIFFNFTKAISSNTIIAVLSLTVFYLNPLIYRYGMEVRTYGFTLLLIMIFTHNLFRIYRNTNTSYIDYLIITILSVFLVLSHYLTVFIVGAGFLYLIFINKDTVKKKLVLIGMLFSLAFIAAYAFNLLSAIQVIFERSNSLSLESNPYSETLAFDTNIYNLLSGTVQVVLILFGNYFQNFGIRLLWLIPIFILLITSIIYYFKANRPTVFERTTLILIIIYFGQIIVLSLLSGHITAFQVHYAIFVIPFSSIIIGNALSFYLNKADKHKKFLCYIILYIFMIIVSNYPILVDYGLNRSLNF